ncbi:HNH endonuclease signature motif containing protein [Kutzneria albida]|uniref:HNH nuclease domain-containing protein n=1 Tax=Kutzneria albida DSM 43870 TaxID=1449976 RepID=W5WFD0_9PSEU|nr:HNH endonuclease signature motif containing protein [Kutzneria albida]AHH99460.1 hypothetical protein KALB_6100 [Kutzneria albida DSM 43870]
MTAFVETRHAAGLWRSGDAELLGELQDAEVVLRQAYAKVLGLVAEADARGVAERVGYPSLSELLRSVLLVSKREAKQRIVHAGVPVPVPLEPEQLSVIDRVLRELPPHVGAADREQAVEVLAAAAQSLDASNLVPLGREIVNRLDPDGALPSEDELAHPRREFRYDTRRDGSVRFQGCLDAETGALLGAVLSPLAKPHDASDTRTLPERQGDAFAELLETSTTPTEGGERPHIAVTIDWHTLKTGTGKAELAPSAIRRLACDAKILPVVLGSNSEPLDVGRISYTVPPHLRRALIVRDKHCAFPGCRRRPSTCHVHHIIHWANGGDTALSNLVLLCGMHHRLIHHSGWTVRITNGRPEFTGPEFLRCRQVC